MMTRSMTPERFESLRPGTALRLNTTDNIEVFALVTGPSVRGYSEHAEETAILLPVHLPEGWRSRVDLLIGFKRYLLELQCYGGLPERKYCALSDIRVVAEP